MRPRRHSYEHTVQRLDTERQDLTRISNIDDADVRGLAPRAVRAPAARPASHHFFVQRPRVAPASRGRSILNPAGCARRRRCGRAIRRIRWFRQIRFPLRLWGRPSQVPTSKTNGVFGCVGMGGGLNRIASDRPCRVSATSRDLPGSIVHRPRRRCVPRPLTKRKTRDRTCRRSPDCSRSKSANIGVIDVRNPR